jgi:sarcosine oxidase subunit beta
VDRDFIKKACPRIDLDCGGHGMPVLGALHHPPGGILRHDAVAWGYARGADQAGVEIHQGTEVIGIKVAGDKVSGVETTKGFVATEKVLSAVAGYTPKVTDMVGIRTPLTVAPLQACVTEPLKPWLNTVIVSSNLHIYVSQSSRGELVMGAALDPYELHATRVSLSFMEGLAGHILELFPCLADVKVMRQWSGLCDMTPDFAPIMSKTPIRGFYLDTGWGTWGFKGTPGSGKFMAHTMFHDQPHEVIEPFRLSRFEEFALVGEKGAASVGS